MSEANITCEDSPLGDANSEFLVFSVWWADEISDPVTRGAAYFTVGNLCSQMRMNSGLTPFADSECTRAAQDGNRAVEEFGLTVPGR